MKLSYSKFTCRKMAGRQS